ncbi:RNA-binding protein Ro60 [Dermacentor andersoni]|uniref:RNA-binding protein Ro60 n=1 Tax=Dermacentor andersoni TaxID=34620 RepID=UPI002155F4C9|nr:RNA-binding protein Ro60-like [Dermacentor andersoni]
MDCKDLSDSLIRLRRFLRTGLEGSRYHAGGVGGAGTKFSSESAPTIHSMVEGPYAYMVMEELLHVMKSNQKSQWQAACPEAVAYSLAVCAASDHRPTKAAAYLAFREICKCPSQLFAVTRYLEQVSEGTGWGRAHRRAVAHWYSAGEYGNARQLAAQATRVVRRHRWTHADLLRLAHVRPPQHKPGVAVLLRYLTHGLPAAAKLVEEKEAEGGSVAEEAREVLAYLQAVHEVRHTKDEQVAARLMEEHQLTLEHVPSHLLRSKEVWLYLVRRLPLHELVKHVPQLSRAGLLARGPLVGALRERLQSACKEDCPPVGPLETYVLKRSLEAGRPKHHNHHHRSSSSHQLDDVVAALHEHSFRAVPPNGMRYLVAVDVRGPMTHARTRGLDGLTPAEVSALLLQALVRSRDAITAVAFSARGLAPLDLDAQMSLADISRRLRETPMGPVDVSLPLQWAREQKRVFDLVLVCTDNQTQSWSVHPAQALKEYQESCNIRGLRFAVCAMCSQGFSLAPPDELNMLDIAGCDSRTIHLIKDFATGLF